ncbi:hypothetical protein EGW08_022285 [Elysia chlorotica]|uniref:Phosphatidylinositol transfer protein N-terminal domain-containing protein n=1 Tax=Elysia chlorotica TaxID=188477 RepID=A0A433SLD8_ELYCH|nr:hypothetical protein EGW08_022285 [Elysia chlorotica]
MNYSQNHTIREYRITLPLSVEEYHVGQLYSVAQVSKNETGGGEGVEVIVNEPFDATANKHVPNPPLKANGKTFTKGQFTHKIYYLSQKVPAFVRLLAPKGALEIHELAWNAYPYCRTVITVSPNTFCFCLFFSFLFFQIHDLSGRDLSNRSIVKLDIANDKVASKDYKPEWDPCLVGSRKAGRPPLPKDKTGEWMNKVKPVMTCYKVVKIWFKWFGLQKRMESFAVGQYNRLFLNFHRQVVCWLEEFYGLTIADIRRIEAETKEKLDKQRHEGQIRGMTATDDDK